MSANEKGIVSAVGTSFEVIKTLVNGTKELGGEEDDLRRILSDQYVREKIIKILCSKTEVLWTGSVIIDHTKNFKQRVKNYGLVFNGLSKKNNILLKNRRSRINLVLLRFNKKILVEEAINKIFEEKNLQIAGLEEAIALGNQHPNVVYKFANHLEGAILAPGGLEVSPNGNYVEVPSLFWSGGISLSTHQFVKETNYYTSFLFIKSIESTTEDPLEYKII